MIFFSQLEKIIDKQKSKFPNESYTAHLFQMGNDRILQKVGEESIEYILEAKNQNQKQMISEAADLIYHLLVSLRFQNISLADIEAELKIRHERTIQE